MKRAIHLGGVALFLSTLLVVPQASSAAAAGQAIEGQPLEGQVAGVVAQAEVSEEAAASGRGITVAREVDGALTFENYEAPSPSAARAFVNEVQDDSGVAAVAVNTPVEAFASDTYYSSQWDMSRLNVDGAQAISNGNGIVVAVVDTGVQGNHADLNGQVLPGIDLVAGGDGRTDPNGHGTHVAGTIAALTNNNMGVTSVAPGARILPVRVLDGAGSGYDNVIANGIKWAADNGADVINLSLGGAYFSSLEEIAVDYATSKGVVVVAAAGNSGNTGNPVMYPAAFANAFAVSATASNDSVPAWSEHHPYVDIAAPGDAILSTVPGGYAWKSGTSMASPHVAAAAALVLAQNPSLTVGQVRARLEATSIDLGAGGRDDFYGVGLLNPVAALNSTAVGPPSGASPSIPAYPTGAWTTAGDGGVFSFSGAQFYGSTGNISLNQPIVGMATTGTGSGYRFVAADGGIFNYGDAQFFGSMGDKRLNQPIVGMASTPSGNGYWMVASDGGIFSFGDAQFYGSTGAIKLNRPIVGMAATPSGRGYWMVASDGGVFAFGDAQFFGSAGGYALNSPVVGMGATNSGTGYYIATRNGAVYAFGDAQYKGGLSADNVVGVASSPTGSGYVLAGSDGSVTSFGDAVSLVQTTGRMRLNRPVVGISLVAR